MRIRLFSKGVFFVSIVRGILFQKYLVDWSVRCETPVGVVGQVRSRRSASDEEAHRPPHGKRATGAEINLYEKYLLRKR
ncbi:hypothetical protein ACFFHH_05160 [Cytobacillus solani]|uniref:hypothetical protein n=1 Tax=Cytobacillus solani TaxID=1637975 RepID=UPI0015EF1C65|nr:hypothetical protein [Cytobacillus solani]